PESYRAPPTLESLPASVLDIIFGHVITHNHTSSRERILPLGRVSLKMCDHVNRFLYYHVSLHNPRSFDKLVSTLLTSTSSIAPLIRSFSYTAPGEFTPRAPSGYLPSDMTPILAHLPTILHLCPNIHTLVLENLNDISRKDWEHLFPASAVALQSLRRFSWSYYSGWRRGRNFSRVWFPVLARCPYLTDVRVANCVIDPLAVDSPSLVNSKPFLHVRNLSLENICWSMQDMDAFAPLFPNVELLDLKTIKVFPYPTSSHHPLLSMFKNLRALSIDCASRILSPNHHICSFLAPSLRNSLEYLSISGGCSLCPSFFNNLHVPSLTIHLSQLRVCGGFENVRALNDAIIAYVHDNDAQLGRVLIEAPSLAVVDRRDINHGGETDIGRQGVWTFADIDRR
ncbi:uncharacterized protein V1516DRAFT_616380, partial [Lipomyces oligophaga]|uniref:uncharacterized protein n=1 Tax=Lipomyces oligophaga TaxID=45792 RepID=UPI0034CE3FB6